MVRRKFFISFLKELDWLNTKNRNGYELDSRTLFGYDVKKTCIPVSYEYVFLKKGKKSYKKFDYKSKDPKATAVYANGDMLLVKKPLSDGPIKVFEGASDKAKNAAEKRTALNTSSLLLIGIALIFAALMRIVKPLAIPFLIIDIILILAACYNYYLSYSIGKYIKSSK